MTIATLTYVLSFAQKDNTFVFDAYLDHGNPRIALGALYCLARESVQNRKLRERYALDARITQVVQDLQKPGVSSEKMVHSLLILGVAQNPKYYPYLTQFLQEENPDIVLATIKAIGQSKEVTLVPNLIPFLPKKNFRPAVYEALQQIGPSSLPILHDTVSERLAPLAIIRSIPMAMQLFPSKMAVHHLLALMTDTDLTVRLEVVRTLSVLRAMHPELRFNRNKVVSIIYDECRLYHQTLSAMHNQIIISYRNRTKSRKEIGDSERDARTSLLEILERRLDSGLERIFKLLGLRYQQRDVNIAYEGLLSQKQEAQLNAIEFLDNLLTGELKRKLLPIIEDSAVDISSEEQLQKVKHKIPSEMECFQLLLQSNDLKVKLAVLYLIAQQKEPKYLPIVEKYLEDREPKIRSFALEAQTALRNT